MWRLALRLRDYVKHEMGLCLTGGGPYCYYCRLDPHFKDVDRSRDSGEAVAHERPARPPTALRGGGASEGGGRGGVHESLPYTEREHGGAARERGGEMSDNSESKITDKERVDFLEKGGVFTLEKYCDKRNGICWPTRFKPTFGWEISRDTVRDVLDAAIRKGL